MKCKPDWFSYFLFWYMPDSNKARVFYLSYTYSFAFHRSAIPSELFRLQDHQQRILFHLILGIVAPLYPIAINLRKLFWLPLSFSPQKYDNPFTKLFIFLGYVYLLFLWFLYLNCISNNSLISHCSFLKLFSRLSKSWTLSFEMQTGLVFLFSVLVYAR